MKKVEFHIFDSHDFIDVYPVQCGKEICDPLHTFGPFVKQNFLFHYIISGKGTFFQTEQQKAHYLTAGQGFLIPPNQICSYEADLHDPWTYIWIELNGLKVERFFRKAGLMEQECVFTPQNSGSNSKIEQELFAILNHQKRSSIHAIGHIYLFFEELIAASTKTKTTTESGVNDLYVTQAIQFIEQHFAENISIEDIAKHCNLNRSYFSRLFKDSMNVSPQQFLIHYRLIRAADLLKNTHNSIASISEQVGYPNQFNFSAAFKRLFQQSPQAWRKNPSSNNLMEPSASTPTIIEEQPF